MNSFPILTILTLVPFIGAVILIGMNAERRLFARGLALGFSLVSLCMVVGLWLNFDPSTRGMQFSEHHDWIPSLGAEYVVGIDGLGLLMLLLTALVVPMAMLASWKIQEKVPLFYSLVLLLQAGLFGTFTALNFFHWFIYWEVGLVPAFFLIKIWGGPQRSMAATQFFVYTMVGSIAMLLSFLAIYQAVGTFDLIKLAELGRSGSLAAKLTGWSGLSADQLRLLIFGGVLLGFAVKVPLMPFHTWLPTAYSEAPVGVTMLLTGLMSKMGVYGMLRMLLPIFPNEMRAMLTPLLWLAVATIVLPACAAFVQRDLKRVFAYSSINHLGYCLLGVFALSKFTGTDASMNVEKAAVLNGVMLQMFNHGITAPILFCFVGFLEQRSGGLRGVDQFGGLRRVAPVYCGLMGIVMFASLGLPGLNGFIGEFLIFKGAFPLATWATALSVLGLLTTAVFLLTVLQKVFNGPLNGRWTGLDDLKMSEKLLVLPAMALMLVIGIFPQVLIGKINATTMHLVDHLKF